MAVAAVIPMSTSRARYRAAKVIAMNWLLSPSSATKITAVLSRKAVMVDRVLSGLGRRACHQILDDPSTRRVQ